MAATVREQGLDKFYTNPDVAQHCLDVIESKYPWTQWDAVIEPSAGNGSFFLRIPHETCIGIDIAPEHPAILSQDFLRYQPDPQLQKILVVGNPPFGKVSSLAIKFFNHAAQWADTIAFIVPRTFRRVSVQSKLDPHFHLLHDEEIRTTPCAFSPPMSAKCCFQIWQRSPLPRPIAVLSTSHPDWEFLGYGPKDVKNQPTPPTGADFAIRAYGGKCGDIIETSEERALLRPKSWHWIKCTHIAKSLLIQRFKTLDYSVGSDTARQNSVGRGELVRLYSMMY